MEDEKRQKRRNEQEHACCVYVRVLVQSATAGECVMQRAKGTYLCAYLAFFSSDSSASG